MKSRMLHAVSAQHVSLFPHSSSDPLGHHLGRLPSLHEPDASTHDEPQKRKFLGSM